MEIRPHVIDRDYILETELAGDAKDLRTGATIQLARPLFDLYHAFATMPDVNGFVLSRMKSKFNSRYTIDVLVGPPHAAKEGFEDRYGRNVRAEVAKVVNPLIDAAEADGELRPVFGDFVAVGEISDPGRNRTSLRRALRAYEDFARKSNRGSDVKADIFIEKTPFTPMQELPADRVKMVPREVFGGIRIESTNRPVMHSVVGAQRLLAAVPEARGWALSSVNKVSFYDIVVNSDTNPQEVEMARDSAKSVISQLAEYMRNAGDPAVPRFGGLVEVPSGSSLEDFKERYLAYTARNRRREIAAAFYFPE